MTTRATAPQHGAEAHDQSGNAHPNQWKSGSHCVGWWREAQPSASARNNSNDEREPPRAVFRIVGYDAVNNAANASNPTIQQQQQQRGGKPNKSPPIKAEYGVKLFMQLLDFT